MELTLETKRYHHYVREDKVQDDNLNTNVSFK